LSLIAAGHYATEFPVVERLAERLAEGLPEVRVLPTQEGRDPFLYV
jgi:putative NIF3 family GTP cyclohydrolase 1 type 2